ncbi:N-acyl homoserine lactonase family protein [Shinella sp.]|uniref:N-acyl homoserine lactonase family protein n=1 Tax=Shinella sp. TaxID=1870904 RepID=UPI00301BFAAD
MAEYSIWILNFAEVPDAATSSLIFGRHNAGTQVLPYAYTLLKGHGKTILLDCGLNAESHGKAFVEKFNVQKWAHPRDVLGEIGVTPEEIDYVILTHAHFDHMGGLSLFPNATFMIQSEELAAWVKIMAMDRKFRWLMGATDPNDMMEAVQLAREGRLLGIDGDVDDILPGIDLRVAPDTHTAHSQYVVVRNDGKAVSEDCYIYTGDLIYRHDNIHGGTPDDPFYVANGLSYGSNTKLLLVTDEIMKTVGNDIRRVLIPHDQKMAELYPSRTTKRGHYLVEVALANGDASRV